MPYFWLNEFCDKRNLPFYGIYNFRQLFASLLVNQGVDIVTVPGALGHSSVGTTSNIYCHMLQEAQAKVSDAVSNALNFGSKKIRKHRDFGSEMRFFKNKILCCYRNRRFRTATRTFLLRNKEQTKNNGQFAEKQKPRKRLCKAIYKIRSW